jgi:hypothetical protein
MIRAKEVEREEFSVVKLKGTQVSCLGVKIQHNTTLHAAEQEG